MPDQNISIIVRAINQASAPLRQVSRDINGLNERTAYLRQTAGTLARIGAVSIGMGAGIAYTLAKITGPAQAVQEQLHRLRNTLPDGAAGMQQLGQAERATAEWSTKLGIAQEGLIKQVYLGTSAGLSMAESIKAMGVASQLAQGLGGDLEATQRTLNLAYINFKDPSKSAAENIQNLGDIMATATAKFDYKNIEELRSQIELATPTAIAAGMNFKDLVATLADFTRHGLTGSVAGEALQESLHGVLKMQESLGVPLAHNTKGGIDLARSLANVREHFIQLYGSMEAIPTPVLQQIQKTFGIRGMRALLIDPAELSAMQGQLNNVSGNAAKFSNQMLQSPREQFQVLAQNLQQVRIQIGDAILPAMVQLSQAILPVAKAAAAFAEAHPGWVRMGAEIAAIGAAVLVVGGALALAASAAMGFASIVPLIGAIGAAISAVTGATTLWTGAQYALDVALDANPLGLMIAGAAALGLGVVEVIKHWQAIKDFMSSLPALAWDVGSKILAALVKPFLDLPEHIRNAWGDIKSAVSGLASGIGRFFIGHSPIPEGPLHNLNLGRELGRSLSPSPVLTALRTTAAAVAFAAPMALAPAVARAMPAAGSGSASYNPTYHITVNAPSGDPKSIESAVLSAIRRHDSEVLTILNKRAERSARLRY